ncbi:MAG: DNA replication/repair protein RecF [Cognaticolwellia aestuarii]
MSAVSLLTKNFRNLTEQSLSLNSQLNFVIGDNGSGKSSFLEALFFLGHGKSFRTNKTDHLFNFGENEFVISIKDDSDNRLGIQKRLSDASFSIRINGEKVARLSDLAKNVAVQVITPESFKLFFGGARERRKFLDLGLFHVKHDFSDKWRIFSKVLKQRNACLRQKLDSQTLAYWTEQHCRHSEELNVERKHYLHQLKEELSFWLAKLLPNQVNNIQLQYFPGWNKKKSLFEVLAAYQQKELAQGYSQSGAQKFDIKFLVEGTPIELRLSRGQQKLFLLALTFAQTQLIARVNSVKPILLIDDIGAELDISSRNLLNEAIQALDCQIIITAIDKIAVEPLIPTNNNYTMFHVEHGKISEISE